LYSFQGWNDEDELKMNSCFLFVVTFSFVFLFMILWSTFVIVVVIVMFLGLRLSGWVYFLKWYFLFIFFFVFFVLFFSMDGILVAWDSYYSFLHSCLDREEKMRKSPFDCFLHPYLVRELKWFLFLFSLGIALVDFFLLSASSRFLELKTKCFSWKSSW